MEKNEDIQLYIKNLQENEINQFYNLPNQKLKRHIIQFKQLIAYFKYSSACFNKSLKVYIGNE